MFVRSLTSVLLHAHNPEIRKVAARVLGATGNPSAIRPLISALQKDDYRVVREAAADSLINNFDPNTVIEALLSALQDSDLDHYGAAVDALATLAGKYRDVRAVELLSSSLLRYINAGGNAVPENLAVALGRIGDFRAIDPLISALASNLYRDRQVVIEALASFGLVALDPLVAALEHPDPNVRSGVVSVLSRLGPQAVDQLISKLGSRTTLVREGVARALGGLSDARAVAPLIRALNDDAQTVVVAVAASLGELGAPEVVRPLISLLEECAPDVCRQVEESLTKIGAPAISPLIRNLHKPEAANALALMGEAATQPLIQALRDDNWWVRRGAVNALGASSERTRRRYFYDSFQTTGINIDLLDEESGKLVEEWPGMT